MSNDYSSLCDDFYLDMCVNTELDLPTQRDTVLTFFERIQKQFPSMGSFTRRNNNECCLQGDRGSGRYRWAALETDRIASGVVNPGSFDQAYEQHRLILDIMPYMLGVNHLDVDSLDVTFAMDFECAGSHDEVIAEALLGGTAFDCLAELPSAKTIGCSPSIIVALSQDSCLQARCSVESRTSIYEPDRNEPPEDEAICLSLTVRRYPSPNERFDAIESFDYQCRLTEELMAEKIVPHFIGPLTGVIAQKRIT
jgi:hypothetical protein